MLAKKSAYFSDSEDSHVENLPQRNRNSDHLSCHSVPSSVVAFPHYTGVLWDRTRLSPTSTIKSTSISPLLVLSSYQASLILAMIEMRSCTSLEFAIELRRSNQLEKDLRQFVEPIIMDSSVFTMSKFSTNIINAQLHKSNSTLAICNREITPCTLTIPVSALSIDNVTNVLSFPKETSMYLCFYDFLELN